MNKLSSSTACALQLGARARRGAPALLAVTLALAMSATATAAPPPVGGLTPLAGQAGCVTVVGGSATCAQARGVDGASSAVVSPDGDNVYLASYAVGRQEGLAVFTRDAATGGLAQLPGAAGCLTADGTSALGPNTCTTVRGFGVGDGRDLAITSDGRWAYLVNQHAQPSDPPSAIVLLRRDPTTGALTQLPGSAGCISSNGSSQDGPDTCQTLATLGRPFGISISPDDHSVYVTDYATPSRIHVLSRDPVTGALSEVQCLSESPAPAGCAVGRVLGNSKSVVLSPNGSHAYSGDTHGVSIFDRDLASGLLTQASGTAGCLTDTGNDDTGASTCATGRVLSGADALAISPLGATLYVAAADDHGVSVFHVADDGSLTQLAGIEGCITLSGSDGLGGLSCATARALTFPFGLAVSPDGRSLYVTADDNRSADGAAVFAVDPATGAATQLPGTAGCITADGTSSGVPGACANAGPAMVGIYDPTLSPDGATVYLPGFDGQTLGIYRRETGPSCQAVSVATPYQTAATVTLRCFDSDGDPVTTSVLTLPAHGTLGPDDQAAGTVVYVPQAGYSGADNFTFTASDGSNPSSPATATVAIAPPAEPPPTPTFPTTQAGHPQATPPPTLRRFRQSASTWREVRSDARGTPTTFSFTLSESARVILTFTHNVAGRRVNRGCVAAALTNQDARQCVRTVTLGAVTVRGRAGRNRVGFNGHLPRNGWLPRGRITVTAIAVASRQRSAAHRLSFVVSR
ncbi:MAG TPA: Ig-like domain-containing protein [Solirubrobacteraceae bacterium]|jgi:sugar lactone lactonase YvrE|nr:Ig-like domain-containing protein [Solirubrobacteraceae bacterium]